jgi:hypothetical protein
MTLQAALSAIQTIVGSVSGIRAAPEYAPDKLPAGIFSVALPASGTYSITAGYNQGLHNITLYVVCPRVDLPKTLQAIIPLGDAVTMALATDVLLDENGASLSELRQATAQTYGDISYTFSTNINLGSPETPAWYAGCVFTLRNVKIQETIP